MSEEHNSSIDAASEEHLKSKNNTQTDTQTSPSKRKVQPRSAKQSPNTTFRFSKTEEQFSSLGVASDDQARSRNSDTQTDTQTYPSKRKEQPRSAKQSPNNTFRFSKTEEQFSSLGVASEDVRSRNSDSQTDNQSSRPSPKEQLKSNKQSHNTIFRFSKIPDKFEHLSSIAATSEDQGRSKNDGTDTQSDSPLSRPSLKEQNKTAENSPITTFRLIKNDYSSVLDNNKSNNVKSDFKNVLSDANSSRLKLSKRISNKLGLAPQPTLDDLLSVKTAADDMLEMVKSNDTQAGSSYSALSSTDMHSMGGYGLYANYRPEGNTSPQFLKSLSQQKIDQEIKTELVKRKISKKKKKQEESELSASIQENKLKPSSYTARDNEKKPYSSSVKYSRFSERSIDDSENK